MTDIALRMLENVPMARYTSLELGGEAQYFFEAKDRSELIEALKWAAAKNMPAVIFGGGSNIVVSDEGIPGLVVRVAWRGRKFVKAGEGVALNGMAGENWDDFVAWSVGKGLTGLECLSGIPGTLGATPVQNVGAYGQEVSSVIESVEVFDRHLGMTIELKADLCGFGYRSSRFRSEADRWVILSVRFRLQRGNMKSIAYRELRQVLGNHLVAPPPAQIRDVVLDLRRAKSMLSLKTDPNRRSVGSFFVNPIVSAETAERIRLVAVKLGGNRRTPGHVLPDGTVKLPAAWLIEQAGFSKGYQRGNVGISDHHALCLVHHGEGSTAELVTLAGSIRDGVEEKFDLTLVPEPVFLGFSTPNPL